MSTKSFSYIWAYGFAALVTVGTSSTFHPLFAQQLQNTSNKNQPVASKPVSEKSLYSDLASLTEQTGDVIVVEGFPRRIPPTADASSDLTTIAMLPDARINKVATSYDYSVEKRSKIYIFRKRYSDLDDIPSVTPLECSQALKKIIELTEKFNPKVPQGGYSTPDFLAKELIKSLSESQLRLLNEKKLAYQSLNQLQASNVQRIINYIYVQNSVRGLNHSLSLLSVPSSICFCWHEFNGHRIFGYESTPESKGLVEFTRLDDVGSSHSIASIGGSSSNRAEAVSTLDQQIAILNKRQDIVKPIILDVALKSKPVTVIGGTNVQAVELLNAFANAYNLYVTSSSDADLRLTTIPVASPANIKELAKAVRSALPDPLLRALHNDELNSLVSLRLENLTKTNIRKSTNPKLGASTPNTPDDAPQQVDRELFTQHQAELEEDRKKNKRMVQLSMRPHALTESATKSLVRLILPKLVSADTRIVLSSLEEEAQEAFACLVMAQSLENMGTLMSSHVPGYVTNVNDLIVGGGDGVSETGRPYVNVTLYLPSPNNNGLVQQCGYTRFLKP